MLLLENRAVCDASTSMMSTEAPSALTDRATSILGNGSEVWWEIFQMLQVEADLPKAD